MLRVIAAEPAECVVERAGLLEIADVTGAWDDPELGSRDRLFELAGDASREMRHPWIRLAEQPVMGRSGRLGEKGCK